MAKKKTIYIQDGRNRVIAVRRGTKRTIKTVPKEEIVFRKKR